MFLPKGSMFWPKEECSGPKKNVSDQKKRVPTQRRMFWLQWRMFRPKKMCLSHVPTWEDVLKQCSSQRREEEKNRGSVKEGSRSWRSASVLGKVYGHGNNICSQITFKVWCLGPQKDDEILIGSLEDSGDISIKFDFVNTLVHVLRLYPEKCKSFELYPFFLFHQGGMGPALSYCASRDLRTSENTSLSRKYLK